MRKLYCFIVIVLFLLFTLNTNNCVSQWIQMSDGMGTNIPIDYIVSAGNYIFAQTVGDRSSNLIYFTTNLGTSWTNTGWSLPGNDDVHSLAVIGTNLYAGTSGGTSGAVWLSTNYGSSWSKTSLMNQDVLTLAYIDNALYAGTWCSPGTYGTYRSTDNGSSWIYCGLGENDKIPYSFGKINGYLLAGTNHDGIYYSTNNGGNWTHSSLDHGQIRTFSNLGNKVFAGTDSSGIYMSSNNGISWVQSGLNNKFVFSVITNGNILFASVTNGGVYKSTDNGISWIQKSEGFSSGIIITKLIIYNNYIFAGSYGQSVWRRPLIDIIGIQKINSEIPSSFSLSQNYPNPFNPKTIINFQMPKSNYVKLIVYDAMGREVSTLVNEKLNPGTYEVEWNASNFPSGIYFYKLQTESLSKTKKMILVK